MDQKQRSVTCKHGASECLGNELILCAQSRYDAKRSLGFAECLISSYERIPDRQFVEACALEHGVDFEELNQCVSDEGKGEDMLLASAMRSREAGVIYSCTVRLENHIYCIRDGGEWKSCPQGPTVRKLVDQIRSHS